tara:strand:- start:284 stop:1501 length:1218 start_codon:yes stop_codon:yes gene_type:complete
MPGKISKTVYNLKPIPEGNKGKGLSKLPKEVRNKMGFEMKPSPYNMNKPMEMDHGKKKPMEMDSSHSFKMKPAMYMADKFGDTVYNMNGDNDDKIISDNQKKLDELKVGDLVAKEGSLQKVTGIDTEKQPDQTITTKRTKLYSDLPESIREQAKADNVRMYGTLNPTAAGKTNNTITTTSTKKGGEITKPKLGEIKQEFDPMTNFQVRQKKRRILASERKNKRAKIKIARAEAKRNDMFKVGNKRKQKREAMKQLRKGGQEGIDALNKAINGNFTKKSLKKQIKQTKKDAKNKNELIRGYIKSAKQDAKVDQAFNVKKRSDVVRKQEMMQDIQGINPGSSRKIQQNYTPLDSFDTNVKKEKGMKDNFLYMKPKPYSMKNKPYNMKAKPYNMKAKPYSMSYKKIKK